MQTKLTAIPVVCLVLRTVAFLYCAFSFTSGHAQGTTSWAITFDGEPLIPPGTGRLFGSYEEDGMLVKAIGPIPPDGGYTLARMGGEVAGFPENGGSYLIAAYPGSLSVNSLAGLPFSAVSVDLAEYSDLFVFPTTIGFLGYKQDGSMVSQQFTTDGIMDGTGPLPDFQTFYFDSRFTDLLRVEVPSYGWALDNFVLASVPEPQSWSLALVAGITFWLRKRFNR